MKISPMHAQILMGGCDDWIDAAEVVSFAIEYGAVRTHAQIRHLVLEVIEELAEEKLVVFGDVKRGVGFVPWGTPVRQSMERVRQEWESLNRLPILGELFWLKNTETGQALGEAMLGSAPREGEAS